MSTNNSQIILLEKHHQLKYTQKKITKITKVLLLLKKNRIHIEEFQMANDNEIIQKKIKKKCLKKIDRISSIIISQIYNQKERKEIISYHEHLRNSLAQYFERIGVQTKENSLDMKDKTREISNYMKKIISNLIVNLQDDSSQISHYLNGKTPLSHPQNSPYDPNKFTTKLNHP